MHYEILDELRQRVLPLLGIFKSEFYLAGGTGLALQIGHRESHDFDFFAEASFDPSQLLMRLRGVFEGHSLRAVQEAPDTLGILIDGEIRCSFFYVPYPLLEPCAEDEHLRIASVADIGCMKLAAVVARATLKDYVDVYYILRDMELPSLLAALGKKMPELDVNLVLKSLVYFEDVGEERINFHPGFKVSFKKIQETLRGAVKKATR